MRLNRRLQLDSWLLPRSRPILLALIAANVLVFGWAAFESPVPAPDAESAPAFSPDVSLKVVTELAPEELAARREAQQAPASSRECRIWGPAGSAEELEGLRERLEAQGGFPELRESLIQSDPDYLVYVAKLGSTEQANRTAQELKTLEIDSYLIRRDDVGPILSVGVFSQEARAERLQERLHKLGYEVVLEALERTQTVFELTGHVLIDSEDYSTSTANCASIAQGR